MSQIAQSRILVIPSLPTGKGGDDISINNALLGHLLSYDVFRGNDFNPNIMNHLHYKTPCRTLFLAVFTIISVSSVSVAQTLPPGGTTSWEIKELEAIVTFVLFDPADPAIDLPAGLRFITAGEVEAPEFEEHLKHHPEHTNWAFSFIEFVRPETFVLDGKALILPEKSGIAVWFAPVDHAQLASEISSDKYEAVVAPSAFGILRLGFWIPDRAYVDYMCARGHHAEYGEARLMKNRKNTYRGKIQLDKLQVTASATPHGDVREEPDPFTQVLYKPGEQVENAVVIAGANVRERDCVSKWLKKGDHPLSRGIFAGKTFLTIEGPIIGSAYNLSEE